MPVPVPVPVPFPAPGPAPPPVRPPYSDLPVRFPCPALPGDGNERRCRPGVRRGTIGRRIGAEMFPECAEIHRWATEWGRSVPRACDAAPLGYGNGRKCSPSVRCGTVGRRKRAEVFPERATRHHWATELDVSVAQACGAFLVCKLLKKDASLHGSRNALWNVRNRLGWSRRKGMLVYPVLDVVLVSVAGVAGDHLTDESG